MIYLSSPIGLGHAQRDLAIAGQLRELCPDAQVDWLAQHPVTRLLEDRGERVHPASGRLDSESAHIEASCGEHALNAFRAVRGMDELHVNDFLVVQEVLARGEFDLVVADEAWDIDHFLHEEPALKRFAYAWLTDFVGWLPVHEGGAAEAALTADRNAEMIEPLATHPAVRDRSIFVGDPEDVLDAPFGPDLPGMRAWTEANYDFCGYVTAPPAMLPNSRAVLRAGLGCGPDDRLCLVTVGGSAVGTHLLHRVLEAVPLARTLDPSLRFLVVTGPRIDPTTVPQPQGVQVCGYVPDLHRYVTACDLAVVQGGLTTCMELTAGGTPFVFVPLRGHFEQQYHVRHRLERHGAGRCLDYAQATDPTVLAAALLGLRGRPEAGVPVPTDGARRAARMLAELL